MPLMPIPPIATKWMGPISRGSLMAYPQFPRDARACPGHPRILTTSCKTWMAGTSPAMTAKVGILADFASDSRDFGHQIGQPLRCVEPAGATGGLRHGGKARGLGG